MKNERWTEPVEVNLEACGKNTVVGPLEALALLTERWPNTRGLSFVKREAPAELRSMDASLQRKPADVSPMRCLKFKTRPIDEKTTHKTAHSGRFLHVSDDLP